MAKQTKKQPAAKKPTRLAVKAAAIAACRVRGRITPAAVVVAARDPKNPLHREFNWDVDKAAMAHWLDRARDLIREVRLVLTVENVRIAAPYYVSDPATLSASYIETSMAARKESTAHAVLLDELARITGAIGRAIQLSIVFDLKDRFEHMLHEAVGIRDVLEKSGSKRGGRRGRGTVEQHASAG